MVKRTQHIGTFLHNEMGISMVGISPMCDRSSIHRHKIFFLKPIEGKVPLISGARGVANGSCAGLPPRERSAYASCRDVSCGLLRQRYGEVARLLSGGVGLPGTQ